MKILSLSLFFFLSSIFCIAQENISIYLKDETNRNIPFYTVENIKFKENKYVADSVGKVSIPYIKGMSYHLHALGFLDTLITLKEYTDLNIVLIANNSLKEVVISPLLFSAKIKELKAERTEQRNWLSGRPDLNHEIGRIVSFEKKVWLQTARFKLTSDYAINFKSDVFINIYSINENFDKEISALRLKKPWYYQLSSIPDLIFSGHLNHTYDVLYDGDYLTFDLTKLGVHLNKGQYIITIELMEGRTKGIRPYFSRQHEFFTINSYSNAKRVGWGMELAYYSKKYANVIADFTYKEKMN